MQFYTPGHLALVAPRPSSSTGTGTQVSVPNSEVRIVVLHTRLRTSEWKDC